MPRLQHHTRDGRGLEARSEGALGSGGCRLDVAMAPVWIRTIRTGARGAVGRGTPLLGRGGGRPRSRTHGLVEAVPDIEFTSTGQSPTTTRLKETVGREEEVG